MSGLKCPASFHKSPSIQRVGGQLCPLVNFLQKLIHHTRNMALAQDACLTVYQPLEPGCRGRPVVFLASATFFIREAVSHHAQGATANF